MITCHKLNFSSKKVHLANALGRGRCIYLCAGREREEQEERPGKRTEHPPNLLLAQLTACWRKPSGFLCCGVGFFTLGFWLFVSGDLLLGTPNPRAEERADPGKHSAGPPAAGSVPPAGPGEAEGSSRQGGNTEEPENGNGSHDLRAEEAARSRDQGGLDQGKGFSKSCSMGHKGSDHPKGQLSKIPLRRNVQGSLELKKQSHNMSVGLSGVLWWTSGAGQQLQRGGNEVLRSQQHFKNTNDFIGKASQEQADLPLLE